ncbi:MAG: type II toxin-antitoxin system HicA family toxin [Rhodocyclaceae bacterium]|nr:type II toxin-antitoxin system HicA family toxin [Rhodocyclaceae bacterium]
MSKKQKRLERLCATPSPTDFTWDELLAVMEAAGFRAACSGGSHYTFEHTSGPRLSISKTHPSGILKRYQIEAVIDALRRVGTIKDN